MTMNDLHYDLIFLRAPKSDVQSAVRAALQETRFTIEHDDDGTILADFRGMQVNIRGKSDRFKDLHTGCYLSIVFKESDGVTALSFVHRTRRHLVVVGLMFGSMLTDDVEQLISHLSERFERVG